MKYKKIVIAGGGVLGSQIAFQTAFCGYDVNILVREEDNQELIKKNLMELRKTYLKVINDMAKEKDYARGIVGDEEFNYEILKDQLSSTISRIKILIDQKEALENADLLIESITENIKVKESFYKQIADLLEEKTVVVTNSSTLLPSKMASFTGRSEKFLSLHFANTIFKNNMVEVMGHDYTDEKYYNEVVKFAKSIKMIPLELKEEKSGYLLNSMLVPFLLSSLDLYANGISDPKTIDKAWVLGTGAPKGPFQIIDTVGLMTAKNIVEQYIKVPNIINPLLKKMMLPYNYDTMLELLNKYIDKGKLGKSTGEGFYKYEDEK